MFSRILAIGNNKEWMQTRKATLTLEELIETMGNEFNETYLPGVPAELTYIVEIGTGSKFEVKASDESCSYIIEMPIRGLWAILPHNVC